MELTQGLEVRQLAMLLASLPFSYEPGERSFETWVEGLEEEGQPVELNEKSYIEQLLEVRRVTKRIAVSDFAKNLAYRNGASTQEAQDAGRLAMAEYMSNKETEAVA